jgi:hypothetical protein
MRIWKIWYRYCNRRLRSDIKYSSQCYHNPFRQMLFSVHTMVIISNNYEIFVNLMVHLEKCRAYCPSLEQKTCGLIS